MTGRGVDWIRERENMSQIPQPCAKFMLCQLVCYMCVCMWMVALRPDNRS